MIFSILFFIACSDYTIQDVKEDPLIIPPEPQIEVLERDLDDSNVNLGCEEEDAFIIRNIGNADLTITNVAMYATVPVDTYTDRSFLFVPILLAPQEEMELPVYVMPGDSIQDSVIISLTSDDPNNSEVTKQITFNTNRFNMITEQHTVEARRKVDLLLVVDDSGSMSEEQQMLSSNVVSIISGLETYSSDYQIAVITTSSSALRGSIITRGSSDPAAELSVQVIAGIRGYGLEKGVEKAKEALSIGGSAGPNTGFLRSDAKLAIVWISDEDDHSPGFPRDWASFFWRLKPTTSDVIGWSIIGNPVVGCSNADPGDRLSELSILLGGSWTSICQQDWQSSFELITMSAATDTVFTLEKDPVETTIVVHVDGVIVTDWTYDSATNSVIFDGQYRPTAGSTVTIEYAELPVCSPV